MRKMKPQYIKRSFWCYIASVEFIGDSESDFYTSEPDMILTFSSKVFIVHVVYELVFHLAVDLLDNRQSFPIIS